MKGGYAMTNYHQAKNPGCTCGDCVMARSRSIRRHNTGARSGVRRMGADGWPYKLTPKAKSFLRERKYRLVPLANAA